MKIGIVADHGGYKLKEKLEKYLSSKQYTVFDYGTDSLLMVDFPDLAFKLCEKVIKKEVDFGIAICKTGIGMSIACNKVKGIRCAKIDSVKDSRLAKEHNGANIIAFNSSFFQAKRMINAYLKSKPLILKRYEERNNKITRYENEH